ncbi:Maf family nucleotide pyrophosphatase [Kribbella jiaozuonensis]|uniref:Nucleoside triphosphate pyrophosphatase n=1 Tax=Kribbella jiaozuonensis TaxID=2575441 RepID=A0A4U3M4D8_9ACTN|nr:Maf family nucleotide pyrophosphatase [Kribbella jiaozuonensis]TKK82196.1 septum formation inhibitor Maf [Kribbella jiaozuonensis]
MSLRFVLASASPARLKTLRGAGVEPEVIVSGVDEDHITAESPGELARLLATLKARAVVASLTEHATVLGCDSVLELDGVAYGKPGTPEIARERLRMMRGRSGVLHTGHCLIDTSAKQELRELASTTVHFADLTDDEIDAYVATGEPLVVAGSFTVDGLGGPFVTGVEGDYHNVVGISLPLLRRMLAQVGIAWPELWKTTSEYTYDETVASTYDETRGGLTRAVAAAEAVDSLLPKGGRVLELAVGTGIVGAELVALGNLVHGVDLSPAMLQHARVRLPGHVLAADAATLPIADRRCDAVVAVWLLHLLNDSEPVIAEVARVLRTDGVFVTTTEKTDASRYADGRGPNDTRSQDSLAHLAATAARHGLLLDGVTTFYGPTRNTGESPVYPLVRFRRL